MNQQKLDFLRKEFIPLLQKLDGTEKGAWGIMNSQEMVEHFADAVKNASGKLKLPALTEGDRLEQARAFMLSEKPFNENTANPLIDPKGTPLRQPDMKSAIAKLQSELDYFFEVFTDTPNLKTGNAFFGQLNYEENVHLLYKHAIHHLKQFGLVQ